MRVLVIGSGGREHALAWKLAQSPSVDKLFRAPGNPGAAGIAENVELPAGGWAAVAAWAERQRIDLTVVGPEDPLVEGAVDAFEARGLVAFGPRQSAAMLEGSKAWAKSVMAAAGVPTAASAAFDSYDDARAYLEAQPLPIVVKADGLARGKGVTVARTRDEALAALDDCMLRRVFGDSGSRVVIEEFLTGREVSVFSISDGERFATLPPACDYKPIFDGDRGPNTGGVGSYTPPGFAPSDLVPCVERDIVAPTLATLRAMGRPYRGLLYTGLMVGDSGVKVLEYNARFGDPETQVVLPLLDCDLATVLRDAAVGRLDPGSVRIRPEVACGVVATSAGYPGHYETGKPISGLDALDPDCLVIHAGTAIRDGKLVTNGGRVLMVVATASDMRSARDKAYDNIRRVHFDGIHYRTDIALREVT
jgi:phosphoribosylamine--glycine ligase